VFRIQYLLAALAVLLLLLFLTRDEKQELKEGPATPNSSTIPGEKVKPLAEDSRPQASQTTLHTTAKPLPLPSPRQASKKSGEVPVDVMEEARQRSRDQKDPVYIEEFIEQALKDPDASR